MRQKTPSKATWGRASQSLLHLLLGLCFAWHVDYSEDVELDVDESLPAQESYNEAHQQNAQSLHYLPAGTNILAPWGFSPNGSRLHNTPKRIFKYLC